MPPEVAERMCEMARKAYPNETGGILIGESIANRIVAVADATEPPADSKATPHTFQRGVEGLVERLAANWRMGLYYVGEWHAHPGALPTPSYTDRRALAAISRDASLHCASPLLVIVGGTNRFETFGVYVQWSSGGLESLSSRMETDQRPTS